MATNIPVQVRFDFLLAADWYPVAPLLRVIKKIRASNYAVRRVRIQLLEELNAVPSTAPFSMVERFPANMMFVLVEADALARAVADLRAFLMESSREKEKPGMSNQGRNEFERRNENDAKYGFSWLLTELPVMVMNSTHLFVRETFETHYGLSWGEGAEPGYTFGRVEVEAYGRQTALSFTQTARSAGDSANLAAQTERVRLSNQAGFEDRARRRELALQQRGEGTPQNREAGVPSPES